ncbi:MAG TPA: AtpZ/AtpI family protein [Dehalococcoidia bacterium]
MGWLVPAVRLLGIGWYFATALILGILAGLWLDGTFETKPLFTLLGTFLGLAAALYGGYRMLSQVLVRRSGGG